MNRRIEKERLCAINRTYAKNYRRPTWRSGKRDLIKVSGFEPRYQVVNSADASWKPRRDEVCIGNKWRAWYCEVDMSQETVKERRMAERGREKGRRTRRRARREKRWHVLVPIPRYTRKRGPETAARVAPREIGARNRLEAPRKERKERNEKKRSGYLRQIGRSPRRWRRWETKRERERERWTEIRSERQRDGSPRWPGRTWDRDEVARATPPYRTDHHREHQYLITREFTSPRNDRGTVHLRPAFGAP